MTTRRNFFRSLVIASAAVYLRLAPDMAKAVPVTVKKMRREFFYITLDTTTYEGDFGSITILPHPPLSEAKALAC